jgi:outer membrane lipase/esterase
MPRRALLAVYLASATLAPMAAQAASNPINNIVVFGDSLNDNGNLSIATGAAQISRFTTNPGHVAIENVAAHYGVTLSPSLGGGTDFAYGGAGVLQNAPNTPGVVPMVPAQVDSYLAAHPTADPRTMYAIWGGNNDLLYHVTAVGAGQVADQLIPQATAGLSPAAAAATAAQIRTQIAGLAGVSAVETNDQAVQGTIAAAQQELVLINRLQSAGAGHVLVINLPDLGLTPGAIYNGPQIQAAFTTLSATYDAQLNAGLAGRKGVVPVNTFALLREVIAAPAHYGFSNATMAACTTDSSFNCTPATLVAPDAGTTHVFADDIHPTTATHAALAQAILSELTAPGQMSLLAEAPLAFARDQRAAIGGELDAETLSHGPDGVRLFVVGRAGRRSLDGDFDAPKAKSDGQSVTFGVMARHTDLSLGAVVTTTQGVTKLSDGAGEYKPQGVLGAVFGQYRWSNGAWLSADASAGGFDLNDIQRSFMIGAALRTELSTGKASVYGVAAEAGKWFVTDGGRFGPFAALSYDHVDVNGVQEIGDDSTAMWFSGQHRDSLIGKLGWKLAADWNLGATALQPSLSVAYGHDFKADRDQVTAGLVTLNGEFALPGYAPLKDWGEVTARLGADLGHGFRGQLQYEGRYGDQGHDNLGSIAVSYNF